VLEGTAWGQTELPQEDITEWLVVGGHDAVAILELIERGWTPDLGAYVIDYGGRTMTIASAVSLGMSADEAERRLAAAPGYPEDAFGL
jgi:hypothetical protein